MARPKRVGPAKGYGGVMRGTRPAVVVSGERFGSGLFPVNTGPGGKPSRRYRNREVFLAIRAKRKRQIEANRWFKERFGKKRGDK